ncbi:MAG: ABC transporter permease subunit, partial [Planctomycetota bacterium]
VAQKLVDEAPRLASAWCVTFGGMTAALAAAVVGGVLLAVLFTSSRWAELSFFPFAVVLQVTPLVAIAPLLLLWLPENVTGVRLLCAWIVAFFPILANTAIGLRSVDPGLASLMRLYHASRWQRFRLLLVPSALPYFLGGLRVATNLALVGAVVAEFVTGAGTQPEGLATIVFEAQYLTDAPLLMAALGLISATGIAMYFATHLLSGWLLGGWHESRVGANDR